MQSRIYPCVRRTFAFPGKWLFAIFTVVETTKFLGETAYPEVKKILLFKLKYYHQSEAQAIYT